MSNLRDVMVTELQRPVKFAVEAVGHNLEVPTRVYALAYLAVDADIGFTVYNAVSERIRT